MHKTEGANHSSNLFTDGPPGTTLEEKWLNAVQNEIRNVIEDAGIVLKTAATETGDQLSAAITLLAAQTFLSGAVQRSQFRWKDADEIYIGAGAYHHEGSSEQTVYWDSELTYQFTALGASDWSYLYLDDGAIVALGTDLLTNAEFTDSVTEPVYNQVKKGWYNGSDRCIMAVLTDGASAILEFWHDGGRLFQYGAHILDQAALDFDAWTDVELTIPKFSTEAQITLNATYVDGTATHQVRTNGSTGGHRIAGTDAVGPGAGSEFNTFSILTDSDQKIETIGNAGDNNTHAIRTNGYFFPTGM